MYYGFYICCFIIIHIIDVNDNNFKKYIVIYYMAKENKKEKIDDFTLNSWEKQKIWRQKQIDIFYKNGRPIFGKYDKKNNKHIMYSHEVWRFYNK